MDEMTFVELRPCGMLPWFKPEYANAEGWALIGKEGAPVEDGDDVKLSCGENDRAKTRESV